MNEQDEFFILESGNTRLDSKTTIRLMEKFVVETTNCPHHNSKIGEYCYQIPRSTEDDLSVGVCGRRIKNLPFY